MTHVHFIGLAGIGVSALARVSLARGYQVSGSDLAASPLTAALAGAGAQVYQGHDAAHVGDADLVVISSAVREDNPELAAARHRGIPVIKRAEMLARVLEGRRTIAVAGTHGKTTTSALVTFLLDQAGLDPLALVGGQMLNLSDQANARLGAGPYAVAEADEYDASFLRLHPHIAIVTNVEPDHLDFYGDFTAVQEAFRAFMARVAADGLLVTYADDPVLAGLSAPPSAAALAMSGGDGESPGATFQPAEAPRITYSLQGAGDWNASQIRTHDEGTSFHAGGPDGQEIDITTRLFGSHNVANALAGIAVARHLDLPLAGIAAALARFRGTRRRMEFKGGDAARSIAIFDDYAHHPTEIRVNLAALRARFPRRRLRCVFQPHTYSRTRDLLPEFARCFADADEVVLTEIYAARETDTLGISGADLAAAVRRVHGAVRFCPTLPEAAAYITDTLAADDVVVTMGAGDVSKVGDEVVGCLS